MFNPPRLPHPSSWHGNLQKQHTLLVNCGILEKDCNILQPCRKPSTKHRPASVESCEACRSRRFEKYGQKLMYWILLVCGDAWHFLVWNLWPSALHHEALSISPSPWFFHCNRRCPDYPVHIGWWWWYILRGRRTFSTVVWTALPCFNAFNSL